MYKPVDVAHKPMQRLKLRSNTERVLSGFKPIKYNLPIWYVVNATERFCSASHESICREVLISRTGVVAVSVVTILEIIRKEKVLAYTYDQLSEGFQQTSMHCVAISFRTVKC